MAGPGTASRLLAPLIAAAFVAMAVPVAANHMQSESGRIIVFDHVAGNEWWVEVALSGQDAGSVASVEAMDTNGPWTPLAKKSWGPYAASFHIEPGNQVRFRASWAGGAQSMSCWFTHPAGVEQCAPQPASWTVNPMGDGASNPAGHDLAVGDVDGDGRNEVYLTSASGLWQFAWTSTGWTRTQVQGLHATEHVAVGDITGDGQAELFASGPAGFEGRHEVSRYDWDGQAWSSSGMHITDPDTAVTSMLVADVEDDGRADLYFGTTLPRSLVMQIEFESIDGFNQYNTRFVVPFSTSVTALGAGDPDNDGDLELVVGEGNGDLRRLDLTESTGTTSLIGNIGPHPVRAIAIGEPEGDGKDYLYAAAGSRITRWVGQASSIWAGSDLPSGPAWTPMDLAVGDADNAGFPELLVSGNDGRLYRLAWVNGAWTTSVLAATEIRGTAGLLVGDGDGDGLREAYLAGPGPNCCSAPPLNPIVQVTDHAVPARPPPAWHESLIGDAGGRSSESDIAIGDGDRDGRNEVYVAARMGLYQFEWTGTAWQRTLLSGNEFSRVAVGDGDRDGNVDVYAAGSNPAGGFEILRFTTNGAGGWTSSPVHGSVVPVGTMTIGDVDDDGTKELYIAMTPEFGGETDSMPSYQLEFEGGGWQVRYITNLVGGARSSWIGDADRDGDRDWYVVGASVYRLDITTAGAGSQSFVGGDLAGEDNWFNGIVSADGDRDGRQELYVGASRFHVDGSDAVYRYAFGTSWGRTVISLPSGAGPRDLAFGDADNDGTAEVYFSSFDGGLYRLRWTGTAWDVKSMADIGAEMGIDLALGDADGDGKVEAYMTAFDTSRSPPENVYRLGTVAPSPITTFDATFTAVRGNQYWEQVTVSATGGTLSNVDVRLNGGAWQPMTKQSYGYTASIRAVQGTIVQFRATSTAGATDLSDCYRWIPPANTDATKVACSGGGGTTFDATFTGVQGNAWWVQTSVSANEALAGVDARVNCGSTWKPLTKQSYGWSASFNVPPGSKVDFRARSTSGATDLSAGYIWPNATPTSAC